ncbi:MAG: acylphosphatase [Steroidobacteraceae bacterium]
MTDSQSTTRRFWVSGRVQGVFYRASAREQALRLNLRGYAKNLPDGRVEVMASGEPAALASLEEWLWQGSLGAEVMDVETEAVAVEVVERYTSFVTR